MRGAFDDAGTEYEGERLPASYREASDLDRVHGFILAAGYRHSCIRQRAGLMAVRRFDKARKQRMRPQRPRLELRMELNGQEPRVRGQFRDLDEFSVRRTARDAHALLGERPFIEAVELEAVAMALVDQRGAIDALGQRTWRQLARIAAQPHRSAELVDPEKIPQLVNDLVRGVLVHLG